MSLKSNDGWAYRSVALIACLLAGVGFDAAAQSKAPETREPEIPATPTVGSIWESTAAPAEEAAAAPDVVPTASGWKPPAVMDRGILVDLEGFTLYIFDGDRRPNVSTCFGICETLWPPLFAAVDSTAHGDFSLVHRRDGSRQWAWRGKPLYRWARDRKPGDVTGDKVNKVWHLIKQWPDSPLPPEGTH